MGASCLLEECFTTSGHWISRVQEWGLLNIKCGAHSRLYSARLRSGVLVMAESGSEHSLRSSQPGSWWSLGKTWPESNLPPVSSFSSYPSLLRSSISAVESICKCGSAFVATNLCVKETLTKTEVLSSVALACIRRWMHRVYCPLKKWKQCEGNSCLWPGSGGGAVVATPPEAAIYNIQPPARPNANHPTRAPPILCGSIPALLRVVYIPVALMPIIGSNPCHFCTPLPRPLTTLKGLQSGG